MGQRFSAVFSTLHFAINYTGVFTLSGNVMDLGDEAGILEGITNIIKSGETNNIHRIYA